MKLKKVLVHASLALCAVIVLSCVVAGCGKREEKKPLPEKPLPEVYPAEGYGYMKDPEFKEQLDAQDAQRKSMLGEREKLAVGMEELEKKAGSRAAAEKTPEWQSLMKQMMALAQSFESNRLHTVELFRERSARAMADSERIKRGEATAKKISK